MEDLFKKAFEDYKVEPSAGVWQKIEMRMRIQDFFRFQLNSMNAYYIAGIAVIASAVWLLSTQQSNHFTHIDVNPISSYISSETLVYENNTEILPSETYIDKKLDTEKGVTEEKKSVTKPVEKLEPANSIFITSLHKNNIHNNSMLRPKFPELKSVLSSKSGCAPLVVDFFAEEIKNARYFWNFGDGSTAESSAVTYVFENAGKYLVTLIVRLPDGRSLASVDSVEVHPSPDVSYTDEHNKVVMASSPFKINIDTKNASDFTWWANDKIISDAERPNLIFSEAGNYHISLTAGNKFGCVDSQEVLTVEVKTSEYNLRFPSAFTPNRISAAESKYNVNQLNNDVFFPVYFGIEKYHFRVFTREGKLVFETTDPTIGWNGYFDNKLLPQGVYIWKATGKYADGTDFNMAGNVTLLYNN